MNMLNGAPSGSPPDCMTQVKNWWNSVPFWCRCVSLTCTLVYALSFAVPEITSWLLCVPALIVYKAQGIPIWTYSHDLGWRLLTGLFVHNFLLEIFFSLMSYVFPAIMIERQMGTVRMIQRFFAFGVLINVISTVIIVACGLNQYCMALWPLIFVDIVCECMKAPEMARG